jgi:hypothetical protein
MHVDTEQPTGFLLPTYGVYAATKAAVEGLTSVLAKELRGRNITVNAVAPGPTATDLFLKGKPQDVVNRMAKTAPLMLGGYYAAFEVGRHRLGARPGVDHLVRGEGVKSNSVVPCNVRTCRSFWFHNSDLDKTMPVRLEGDLLDRKTSKCKATASSARTGYCHLIESIPGEPKASDPDRTFCTISSIAMAHVCHPLAMSPRHRPSEARATST